LKHECNEVEKCEWNELGYYHWSWIQPIHLVYSETMMCRGLLTHQFTSLVPEPWFGKVGWSSNLKSGSQGGGLVENDDEHYEIIG